MTSASARSCVSDIGLFTETAPAEAIGARVKDQADR